MIAVLSNVNWQLMMEKEDQKVDAHVEDDDGFHIHDKGVGHCCCSC